MNDTSRLAQARCQRGFTLIELIIAVAVAAILATIALPSYRAYLYRSNRNLARTLLSQVRQQQEIYFGDRKKYGSLYSLGYPAANDSAGIYINRDGVPRNSASSDTIYYIRVTPLGNATVNPCTAGSGGIGTDYLILATPQGSQSGDAQCATLCLASTNERGTSVSGNAATCWQR